MMRTTAYIVCHSFLNKDGEGRAIGGVETYIAELTDTLIARGYTVTILQHASHKFEKSIDGVNVISWTDKRDLQRMQDMIMEACPGIVVYSDYWCIPRRITNPSIVIQHGIGWDYTTTKVPRALRPLNNIRKRFKRLQLFSRLRRMATECDKVICVDTNFINWMRATFPFDNWEKRFEYVPNFAPFVHSSVVEQKWNTLADGQSDKLTNKICIFPRRFAEIRGAIVFAEIVREIWTKHTNYDFHFVGNGECAQQMQEILRDVPTAKFYSLPYVQMMDCYRSAHVAVIPTIASEGTSLSCIEAMASGCAIVATDVGGLCNLIVPGFNGILCSPDYRSIRDAVEKILVSEENQRVYGLNARRIYDASFDVRFWRARVNSIIDDLEHQYGRV